MAEPIGRAWFYDFLSTCHIYQTSFTPNALTMAHAEGERNVGLRLLADLVEASPDLYLQMLKEANSERHTAERTNADRDDTDADPFADAGPGTDSYA
jgi:hypothetical protein